MEESGKGREMSGRVKCEKLTSSFYPCNERNETNGRGEFTRERSYTALTSLNIEEKALKYMSLPSPLPGWVCWKQTGKTKGRKNKQKSSYSGIKSLNDHNAGKR